MGGGANFFGRNIIGNPTDQPCNYIYAKEYYVVTATAGYRFKLRNVSVHISVAVANLLDYDEPVFSSVAVYQSNTYRSGYRYIEPRKATVTTTLKF